MEAGTNTEESSAVGTSRSVFLSYASHDADGARTICEYLERHGVSCWMAPRDVPAGALYADAIVRAINEAQALVVVLSQSAVASSHVGKEVERASSKKKKIIAFRVDAAPLTPALEYFLSESQWIDVPAVGMSAALAKLKETLDDGQLAGSAMVHFLSGRKTESDAQLSEAIRHNGTSWPSEIARVYAFRGEKDHAFEWLDRAYEMRDEDLYIIKGDPLFKNLEGDPRYKAFLRKMNLPE